MLGSMPISPAVHASGFPSTVVLTVTARVLNVIGTAEANGGRRQSRTLRNIVVDWVEPEWKWFEILAEPIVKG
jgi:hypothetical protein